MTSFYRMTKGLSVLSAVFGLLISSGVANAVDIRHDLRIKLDPASGRLAGVDTVTIRSGSGILPEFHLTSRATDIDVRIDDRPVPFTFADARLVPQIKGRRMKDPLEVTIAYTALFNDPAPVSPVNTDNPGYGVSGTITTAGTLILAGAGWYPRLEAETVTYRLRVEAPEGVLAVTSGRRLGVETRGGQSVSEWVVDHPVRGLSLSAARYRVNEKVFGEVTAATYFFPGSDHLSEAYIEATGRYLEFYQRLFGPYPFDQFAVVENFFPTGYGFPGYTLLGSQVLRLPFIIDTSLGHEIAHCWWGNGVFVDHRGGNWSEGLTTYVADYLYKERESEDAAREYRRQILRNYATLVNATNDFPIARFQSRTSPLTKTIGYDKCAMVFHMLRRLVGEAAFWGALRDVYRTFRFKDVSWRQLRESFEQRAAMDLKPFFEQWVNRSGAPLLAIEDVSAHKTAQGWTVRGRLVQQQSEDFAFSVPMTLQSDNGPKVTRRMDVDSGQSRFEITGHGRPSILTVDPDFDLFRQLHPSEIPASINSIKGAPSVTVVLAAGLEEDLKEVAGTLLLSLGLENYRVVAEEAVDITNLGGSDLLLIGIPARTDLQVKTDEMITLTKQSFILNQVTYTDPGDVFFGVFGDPAGSGRATALFLPLSTRYADLVARKVTHYGRYSYLVFNRGQNQVKGVWPTLSSPLIHRWPSQTSDLGRLSRADPGSGNRTGVFNQRSSAWR